MVDVVFVLFEEIKLMIFVFVVVNCKGEYVELFEDM